MVRVLQFLLAGLIHFTHQAYFYTIHNIIPGLESINFVFLVAHDKLWT